MKTNIILDTDSYKLNHWNQMVPGTEYNFGYFECRKGAKFPETVFFGLQYILLKHLVGEVVTEEGIQEAKALCAFHFGSSERFNEAGWRYILEKYNGRLPISIRAVPEGSVVPVSNVLFTVENTDPNCAWLVGPLETILSQVWYPTTVATLSREVKKVIKNGLGVSSTELNANFGLQDFGFRGSTTFEAAAIGGLAHLVNFQGTDTVPALRAGISYYDANPKDLGFSVPATEHSVMTPLGQEGEEKIVEMLLNRYTEDILSVVADSYSVTNFVDYIVGQKFRDRIMARKGVFVVRPDSITPDLPTPEEEMVWILNSLWNRFGGTVNVKGYKVIHPSVRTLWGDGIDLEGIQKIINAVIAAGFSTENIACFGMGGGLLQKVNRDTQRCAFKSCAQYRDGKWHDVFKNPLDKSKMSKKGRLKLIKQNGKYNTVPIEHYEDNELEEVFRNGELLIRYNFDSVRQRAIL